jgi:eukaryotic-like serine/threonine-protein kinase
LIVLVILVLLGSGLGTFLLFTQHNRVATVGANPVVGHAYFMSSGQVNQATNQGSNDELQVDLQNISDPGSGKSYYAWLLPDKSQSESPPILLGKIPVNHGVVHFFYTGDSYHTNLLGATSRFLITEEDANVTPTLPSPDLTTWRYYAELPQTRAPGDTYSLLDHLRHLLASDPTLEALHLPGGLNLWTFRNTQKLLEWAGSARDEWSTKDFASMHRQIISILDYLDGEALVQQDVPPGTPILADPKIAQVGLLELDPARQNPPGYLYHIALHVNGVLASPGVTQDQRHLATQIDAAMNTVKAEFEQMRRDAIQLVGMNDAQLALPSSLALLDDMAIQANNAYIGHNDPASGQFQMGVSQISQYVQRLATFEVKTYK